jgi:AcrR family transcriptional regulator
MSKLIFMMKKVKNEKRPRPVPERPGKRAANKENTRREILRVALELFSRKGFFKTTTKEISDKAKIAEGTLFNYFKTKEDLALYFFAQVLEGLIDWYHGEKKLQRASLSEKLFAIVHYHLERISPYEEFMGAVYLRAMQPVSRLSPLSLESQELNLRYLRFIQQILNEAEEKGEIPNLGDLGAYAFGVFHVAIISYWLQDGSRGKEKTLELLDRSLKLIAVFKKGRWEW